MSVQTATAAERPVDQAPPIAQDASDEFGPASAGTAQEALAVRWKLACAGYVPVPNYGKKPWLEGWEKLDRVTHDQMAMWGLSHPNAANTGIQTRTVPAFDIDIMNEAAARAVEDMVREQFEEAGRLLMRIGKPPKRAFLFRPDTPFKKMAIKFKARENSNSCATASRSSSTESIPKRRGHTHGSAARRARSRARSCRLSRRRKRAS